MTTKSPSENERDDENIAALSARIKRQQVTRIIVMLLIFCGLLYGAYHVLAPKTQPNFRPLDALSYEAFAMDADSSHRRLSLPSSVPQEIAQFLAQAPGLSFSPLLFKTLPQAWQPDGASFINYDIAVISVVQYSLSMPTQDGATKVFLFALAGHAESLPQAETADVSGKTYRLYGSDRINMLAWQAGPETIGVLAGRSSIKDLLAIVGHAGPAK